MVCHGVYGLKFPDRHNGLPSLVPKVHPAKAKKKPRPVPIPVPTFQKETPPKREFSQ